MPIFGLKIRARAPWSLHHTFFITNIRSHGTQPCGTGYGLYLTPKRSNFSFGRLCATDYPLKHSYFMVDNMWITIAPVATHLKRLYTYFKTAPGREKSGPNLREYCPYLSFICHYKIGSDIMQRWIELYFPISSRGESISLSPVRNFGLPAMKESSRTNLDPNIVSYTPRCKQL